MEDDGCHGYERYHVTMVFKEHVSAETVQTVLNGIDYHCCALNGRLVVHTGIVYKNNRQEYFVLDRECHQSLLKSKL
jgi:hypothetical protein